MAAVAGLVVVGQVDVRMDVTANAMTMIMISVETMLFLSVTKNRLVVCVCCCESTDKGTFGLPKLESSRPAHGRGRWKKDGHERWDDNDGDEQEKECWWCWMHPWMRELHLVFASVERW